MENLTIENRIGSIETTGNGFLVWKRNRGHPDSLVVQIDWTGSESMKHIDAVRYLAAKYFDVPERRCLRKNKGLVITTPSLKRWGFLPYSEVSTEVDHYWVLAGFAECKFCGRKTARTYNEIICDRCRGKNICGGPHKWDCSHWEAVQTRIKALRESGYSPVPIPS